MKHCRKVVKNRDFSSIDFKYRRFCFPLVVTLIIFAHLSAPAQTRTVGVLSMSADTSSGYTLFSPQLTTGTYLIDNFGRLINSWSSDKNAGLSVYLLPDGSILRCESLQNMSFNGGGTGGRIKRTSWDGETIWTYDYSTSSYCQHHDCEYLPNGNVLIIAWEVKSQSEASAAGRSTSRGLWTDRIIEVRPSGLSGGTIVWEWHGWDHLIQDNDANKDNYGVVAEHPELVDVNYEGGIMASTGDLMHANAVDYNEKFDQILLSVNSFNEVWIIDHSTTTAEAASHSGGKYGKGGDLLYRFGNPEAYKSGSSSDCVLQGQHDAHWIPDGRPGAGNILVFNNGASSRIGSSVDEFSLPIDGSGNYDMDETPKKVWSYTSSGLYATLLSSAQRMANSNTLICHGPKGTFFEIDSDKNSVWEYINPVTNTGIKKQGTKISGGGGIGMQANECFRAYRYGPDYPAFKGKDITPSASPLEGGDLVTVKPGKTTTVLSSGGVCVLGGFSLSSYTNPSNPTSTAAITITRPGNSGGWTWTRADTPC